MSGKGRGGKGGANGSSPGNGTGSARGTRPEAEEPGAAAPEADVVPFRRPVLGAPAGVGRGRRGRGAQDARPAAAAPAGGSAEGDAEEPSLEWRVCSLAARGLSEEEIRARLELPPLLDDGTELMLADAFRRGQLLGRARVKEAQFEAALQGRVTAQAHVLARLGEPRGEAGEEGEQGFEGAALGRPDSPDEQDC